MSGPPASRTPSPGTPAGLRLLLGCHFVTLVVAVPSLGAIGRVEVVAAGMVAVAAGLAGIVLAGRAGDRRSGALPSAPSPEPSPESAPKPVGDRGRAAATGSALLAAVLAVAVVTVQVVTGAVVDPVVLIGLGVVAVAQIVAMVGVRTRLWPVPPG